MRKKGLLTLFITVFSVVAFAGMAFAAQNIFLKTTVPNIPKSPCYQAGTESLALDNLTVLTNGDVFRFTLSNNVTICKPINFYLRLHDGLAVADAALPASTAAEPVTSTNPAADNLNLGIAAPGALVDYGLLVTGNVGSQVVNMQLVARTKATGAVSAATAFTLTFVAEAAAPNNQLIIKLFDKKFLTPYFWKISTGTAYLADSAFAAPGNFVDIDNTLCINTSSDLWLGEYVQFTANSLPNLAGGGIAVAFSGDFFIAHMFLQERYELDSCKGAIVGRIRIGNTVQQGADNCVGFDFETAPGPGNGYCTEAPAHNALNRVVIKALDAPFVADPSYTLKLEILVDKKDGAGFLAGDRGVYFMAGSDPQAESSATNAAACAAVGSPIGATTRFLANGTTTSAGAPADASCSIAAANRAVMLTTAAHSMNIVGGHAYVTINLPFLKYDLATIQPGWEVKVRVTLTRLPCIGIGPLDVFVGTFGCVVTPPTAGDAIRFPYFTSLGDDAFWNGIAIINLSSAGGTATLTAYERDGSVFTATAPVGAKGMFVDLVENLSWTLVSGPAGLGGANNQCFITVSSDFNNMDGFGMIAKSSTGESMGYLPRKPVLY